MESEKSGVRKIVFRQSGGFAGLVRGAEIVLADLPGPERDELETLLTASELAARPSTAPTRSAARDVEQIEITFETDGGETRSTLSALELGETEAPLVAWLEQHARPLRRGEY